MRHPCYYFIIIYLFYSAIISLYTGNKLFTKPHRFNSSIHLSNYYQKQPYHPVAQDRFPTEAKQGRAWSVPGWETSWEN